MPATGRAVFFDGVGKPLRLAEREVPRPGPGELLLRVRACGICRTDLHILDGDVAVETPPRVLGHQIVGETQDGRLVGVPWLGWTCGRCAPCRRGQENLCEHARFTGCDIDGGLADHTVADERYCLPIPAGYPPEQAAPLLCAGLIGHRAYVARGEHVERLGIYGFGAAAHILVQVAIHDRIEVAAFTRHGDQSAQRFATELGAVWAGPWDAPPPWPLDAAIVFAPDGRTVPAALRAIRPGGTVVCGGIHMSDIPSLHYADLWGERVIRSIANLTRQDGAAFMALAPQVPVRTTVTTYPLGDTEQALDDLREGRLSGAAVIVP